jgi:PBP1b-binding outer membrane lipoprotein LpoB
MKSKIKSLSLFLIVSVLFFSGCSKKEEESKPVDPVKTQKETTDSVKTPSSTEDTVKAKPDSVTAVKKDISLLGTWQGKIATYAATLNIKSQTGNQFAGTIVVNYRNVATHSIVGSYNPETKSFSMTDNDETRSAGSYSGKISTNGRSISGKFTEKTAQKMTVNFSFNK